MPRQLLVHARAREDVHEIAAFIALDKLAPALRFLDAAELEFDFLSENPTAGPRIEPPLRVAPDLRFWPIKRFRNYPVLYRALADGVEVIRIVHGARQITDELLSPL